MTMKKRLVSMKATRATTTSQMICLMCCMESLHTMTRLTMRVFKMDNNFETKVVDLRRGKILIKMTRLRMRVFKIDNNIETKVVDLRRGKILTKMTRLRMRVFKIDNNIETKVVDLRRGKILTKKNKITGLARLGKTLCLKVKGNDCGKRRGIE